MVPPLLLWLSKGLRRKTSSSQRSPLAFLGGNLWPATMVEPGLPEVKLHLRLVQIPIYLSMMSDAASPRTAPRGSAATIGMTSTMSLKIGSIPESEHHLHHDGT
jgi:hypothetical protein